MVAEQPDGANGVVVGGDGVIHLVGIELVSASATTGISSRRASSTAVCSFFVSTTKMAPGRRRISADAAERALQAIQLVLQVLRLFLGQPLELAALFARLQVAA